MSDSDTPAAPGRLAGGGNGRGTAALRSGAVDRDGAERDNELALFKPSQPTPASFDPLAGAALPLAGSGGLDKRKLRKLQARSNRRGAQQQWAVWEQGFSGVGVVAGPGGTALRARRPDHGRCRPACASHASLPAPPRQALST